MSFYIGCLTLLLLLQLLTPSHIAVQNFINHVNSNIVEPFLNSKTGPLLGLSTEFICNLSKDEVEMLGGEDETVTVERRNCEEKIKRLEEAKRIADATWKKTRGLSS